MGITGGLQAEAYDRSYGDAQLLRRIGAYFRPHAGTVALVALTVALSSLAATILPLVISQGINALTGSSAARSEEHTSELQSQSNLVCRLLLEKKKCLQDRSL